MGLMLLEYHQPTDEFSILMENRVNPMHDAVAGLVAAATDREPEASETVLLTCCLIGQCLAFGAARVLVLARLGWNSFEAGDLPQVVDTVAGVALATLGLLEESADVA